MQLNSTFISNIRDIYGSLGISWLTNLETLIQELSLKRGFVFLQTIPDLTYNFVGLVKIQSSGTIAVIKIAPENSNLASEAQWLQCFSKGVPQLYWFDEEYHALLMERLEPGNALKILVSAGEDETATRIICNTIRNLQETQIKNFNFKHLSELIPTLSRLRGVIDNNMLSQAESLFHELTMDKTQDVVLHGDLHHDNILSSGLEWKAIDPHGYIGDPAFEVGAMIYNPCDRFPQHHSLYHVVEKRLKILAEELPFDPHKIKAWTFCMTVLSIAWTFEDHKKIPAFELAIASAINKVHF